MHYRNLRVTAGVTTLIASLVVLQLSCSMGEEPSFTPFVLTAGVAIADVNNDGAADIVVASTHFEGSPPHPGSILVYLQSTSARGTFGAPAVYPAGFYPWGVTVADINLDGAKDIFSVGEESPNVFILYGRPSAPGTFDTAVSIPCGPSPYDVAVGDLNNDGLADVAVGLYNNTVGSVSLLFQDRTHPKEFLPDTILPSVTTSLGIALGDLNGDGTPDIAATGRDHIWVIPGLASPAGSFGAPISIQAGVRPQDVAIADLNGDGQNEILVANAGSASDGTGATLSVISALTTLRNYPTPNGARSVVVRDFNGDGRPDVAVSALVYQSSENGKAVVWLQDTSGVLQGPAVYQGAFNSSFIAAGDLNGDGKVDLAVTDPLQVAFQDTARPGMFFPFVGVPR